MVTFVSKIIWIPFYGMFLGFASLSIEATLGVPQLLRNNKTKSVDGLSFIMILTWLGGDFFKTLYFISEVKNKCILESANTIYTVWSNPNSSGHCNNIADYCI